jgi:hypothetical protein
MEYSTLEYSMSDIEVLLLTLHGCIVDSETRAVGKSYTSRLKRLLVDRHVSGYRMSLNEEFSRFISGKMTDLKWAAIIAWSIPR